MAIGDVTSVEAGDPRPSDSIAAAGVILPALAYESPRYVDIVIPASAWTQLCIPDIARALFMVMRNPSANDLLIRPGTNPMAAPFTLLAGDNTFVLRYVDYLNIVTGQLFGFTTVGETITVGTVRQG